MSLSSPLINRLEAIRADFVFGWRQLAKSKLTSAAAILSLALGIGACTSAFRLVDALLLRPLPIADPHRLHDVLRHEIASDGKPLFAWRAAPFVVSMINPPDDPARLILPADWRVFAFGIAITSLVTLLFGLTPALRASSVKPMSALRGGAAPHSRRRLMHSLIAVQVVFCFLVLFVAGLFAATFQRLSHQATGFSSDRILTLDTVAARPAADWDQVAEHLRSVPGVEKVALAGWPLLSGHGWNDNVSINGGPPSDDLTYFLNVAPGWLDVMKIPLIEGRDFRPTDIYPGTTIVNETFAKRYFPGQNALGRSFDQPEEGGIRFHLQISRCCDLTDLPT